MTIEGAPHGPGGGPGTSATPGSAGSASQSLRLQILATEHWSLLATRSMAYNESFSRAGMFLSVLSGAVVALALVAQATAFKEGFALFAILLLPVVAFVGVATFVRLVQVNNEDIQWVLGMNRIRHAYLEMDPTLAPYFMTAWHDDEVGMLLSMASRPGGSTLLHGFITTPGMLAVVDGVLAGVLATFLVLQLGLLPGPAIGIGVAVFLLVVLALLRYQARTVMSLSTYRHKYMHIYGPRSRSMLSSERRVVHAQTKPVWH